MTSASKVIGGWGWGWGASHTYEPPPPPIHLQNRVMTSN